MVKRSSDKRWLACILASFCFFAWAFAEEEEEEEEVDDDKEEDDAEEEEAAVAASEGSVAEIRMSVCICGAEGMALAVLADGNSPWKQPPLPPPPLVLVVLVVLGSVELVLPLPAAVHVAVAGLAVSDGVSTENAEDLARDSVVPATPLTCAEAVEVVEARRLPLLLRLLLVRPAAAKLPSAHPKSCNASISATPF